MISAENLMRVLFLTYDVVRSCEHDREHVVARESIPQSLQPDEGLHLSSGLLFAAVCPSVNVDQFTKFIGIVATTDHPLQPWTEAPLHPHHCGHVATYHPIAPRPTSGQWLITTRRFGVCISPRMTCCPARICR